MSSSRSPAYDVASTVALHTIVSVEVSRLLARPFEAMRAALNAQYLRAYRRRRPIDNRRLRYFEALVVTRRLMGIVVTRRLHDRSGWDDPATINRLQRRLRGLTGVDVSIPLERPAAAMQV